MAAAISCLLRVGAEHLASPELEAMLGVVAAAGCWALDSGGPTLVAPRARGPLLPADPVQEQNAVRDSFAGWIARDRATRLLGLAARWRADLIVRDEVDFGAAVAAERLDIPHVCVTVLAAGGLLRPELLVEPLNGLRAEHRLPADPDLAMLHRYLSLAPVPPSYRTPTDPCRPPPATFDPPCSTRTPRPSNGMRRA